MKGEHLMVGLAVGPKGHRERDLGCGDAESRGHGIGFGRAIGRHRDLVGLHDEISEVGIEIRDFDFDGRGFVACQPKVKGDRGLVACDDVHRGRATFVVASAALAALAIAVTATTAAETAAKSAPSATGASFAPTAAAFAARTKARPVQDHVDLDLAREKRAMRLHFRRRRRRRGVAIAGSDPVTGATVGGTSGP